MEKESAEKVSAEKIALGLQESGKAHEKNLTEAIDSASVDMQERITEADQKKKIPDNSLVMTYSETIVFTGNDLDISRMKKRWTEQYAKKLPGEHAYNLRKHDRTVMVQTLHDSSHLWQTWEIAHVHPTDDAKKRLEENAKGEACDKGSAANASE